MALNLIIRFNVVHDNYGLIIACCIISQNMIKCICNANQILSNTSVYFYFGKNTGSI